jgi:hypothetical protein
MDAHAKDEVRSRRGLERPPDGRFGIERQPNPKPERSCLRYCARRILDGLEVEGDAVGSCGGDLRYVPLRLGDHQVTVDKRPTHMDERGDRLEHYRPHRDRLDEVPIADVEVEDPGPGIDELLDLSAEIGEVGRVQRRLYLDALCPF